MSMFPHSDNSRTAYQKGAQAKRDGKSIHHNPWRDSFNSKLSDFWERGWESAKMETTGELE